MRILLIFLLFSCKPPDNKNSVKITELDSTKVSTRINFIEKNGNLYLFSVDSVEYLLFNGHSSVVFKHEKLKQNE